MDKDRGDIIMTVSIIIIDQIEFLEKEKIICENPENKVPIQRSIDKLMNEYGITDRIKIEKTREELIKERDEYRKETKDWMTKVRGKYRLSGDD